MKLKCKINNQEYDITQGCTFSEEYNETLDSGSIVISQVAQIKDLRPYDDVFIYDGEFNGYSIKQMAISVPSEIVRDGLSYECRISKSLDILKEKTNVEQDIVFNFQVPSLNTTTEVVATFTYNHSKNVFEIHSKNTYFTNKTLTEYDDYYMFSIGLQTGSFRNPTIIRFDLKYNVDSIETPTFYKHLLIDQFTEELINIKDGIYRYKIELFSETKALEMVQLSNISITQPLNIKKKKSVYEYLVEFVYMYSPVEKIAIDEENKIWAFNRKYKVDENLKEAFGSVYAPDFSLNNPSLKDLISNLMLTKDMIPYVKDGIIYGLDISERKNDFNLDYNAITSITGSRSSDNHCDNLRRSYSDALSNENSARSIEYIGFRNSDNCLMTLSNMRLELKFPIYKINKVHMCYYKKGTITGNPSGTKKDIMFLCKQDITKLIKLETERNLLSKNWKNYNEAKPVSIDEMATYQLCTLGYSIGSNTIEGWGTSYTYPVSWFDGTKTTTYIENIATLIDSFNPYGIYSYGYLKELAKDLIQEGDVPIINLTGDLFDNLIHPYENNSQALKSFFFIVDYQAFYNGAITHSKDDARDDITIADNSSSSLTLLERDGIFEKEKANRFGNKSIIITARYDNIDELQELGSVYNVGEDTDVIIYHRDYSIHDNCINATYYGTKSYVLRNYFNSVYSKHRTYNLMGYAESVNRAENKKIYILLSKNKAYYENNQTGIKFSQFNGDYLSKILSFIQISPQAISVDNFDYVDKINGAYIQTKNGYYYCDVNAFVSGNSLCFNLAMFDNATMGVNIIDYNPDVSKYIWDKTDDDVIGEVQGWITAVDDVETGFIDSLGFYVCHIDKSKEFLDNPMAYNKSSITTIYTEKLFNMPAVTNLSNTTNIIGGNFRVHKDNKERIDMTYQIEPISTNDEVMFSSWMMKLSDLISNYKKNTADYTITDETGFSTSIQSFCSTCKGTISGNIYKAPLMGFYLTDDQLKKISSSMNVSCDFFFETNEATPTQLLTGGYILSYTYSINEIIKFDGDEIITRGMAIIKVDNEWWGSGDATYIENNVEMVFKHFTKMGNYEAPSGYHYYSNLATSTGGVLDYDFVDERNKIYYHKDNVKITPEDTIYAFGNGKSFWGDTQLSSSNAIFSNVLVVEKGNANAVSKTYIQTMYLATTTEKLKKKLVYNEYDISGVPEELTLTDISITDVFSIQEENKLKWIKIDLSKFDKNIKSIQYWYLDETRENINQVNQSKYIVATQGSSFTITYKMTDFYEAINYSQPIVTFDDGIVGGTYSYNSFEKTLTISYNMCDFTIKHGYYIDFIAYKNVNTGGTLKFVFGVNIGEEDWKQGYVRVNVSIVSTKDTRVYDINHNLIGEITNYVDDDTKEYGENQYYCDIIK